MSNTQTDNSRNANQQGSANADKKNQQQKKGFEQGNGNNSTTADPKASNDQKNNPQHGNTNSQDQSKITNEDNKITNKDESMRKDPKAQAGTNDDEDVDENSQVEGYKEEQEIDTPIEETEENNNQRKDINRKQ